MLMVSGTVSSIPSKSCTVLYLRRLALRRILSLNIYDAKQPLTGLSVAFDLIGRFDERIPAVLLTMLNNSE